MNTAILQEWHFLNCLEDDIWAHQEAQWQLIFKCYQESQSSGRILLENVSYTKVTVNFRPQQTTQSLSYSDTIESLRRTLILWGFKTAFGCGHENPKPPRSAQVIEGSFVMDFLSGATRLLPLRSSFQEGGAGVGMSVLLAKDFSAGGRIHATMQEFR